MWEGRVLLLDDEESILFGMSEYFRALGYYIECAHSAAEAVERLSEQPFDVLIADLRLKPDESAGGLEVVEWARRTHPETRVMVLTASGADLRQEARRRGANWYLQKPQSLPHVERIVRALCLEARSIGSAAVVESNLRSHDSVKP